MIVGYNEKINKIIIIDKDNKRYVKNFGVIGLNICGNNYTYYDKKMQLHILDTRYIKKIKCYCDKKFMFDIINYHYN